jgi:hypothetical protein
MPQTAVVEREGHACPTDKKLVGTDPLKKRTRYEYFVVVGVVVKSKIIEINKFDSARREKCGASSSDRHSYSCP